jgi:hypothetical protein
MPKANHQSDNEPQNDDFRYDPEQDYVSVEEARKAVEETRQRHATGPSQETDQDDK